VTNTVEVIVLNSGKRVFSVRGQSMPQGVFYSTDFKRLFVANGKDGSAKISRGDNFELIDSLSLGTNPNHVGYDPGGKYLYVGIGIPISKAGALAIIDTPPTSTFGEIKTETHPGGIKIETSGPRIFVTLGGVSKVGGRGSAAGFVYVYRQKDADHYDLTAKVPTRGNAQMSIWVPQLNRYYVSASANDKEDAAILVLEPQ
jgi:DNA-binding beta-propeller fold protein YncE